MLLVTRPIRPLARRGAVFNDHATSANVQLRSGKLLAATVTSAHFGYLLSGSAVQLLQTGAREALGHEFYDVSAVPT